MQIQSIGIDLGKTIFHLIGMDQNGAILLKKRLSRSQLVTLLANTPPCLIGMEASCGAHLARATPTLWCALVSSLEIHSPKRCRSRFVRAITERGP